MPETLPTDPSQYKFFLFYDGYVESGRTSPVLMSRLEGFDWKNEDTPEKAWETAFGYLRETFIKVIKAQNGFVETYRFWSKDLLQLIHLR